MADPRTVERASAGIDGRRGAARTRRPPGPDGDGTAPSRTSRRAARRPSDRRSRQRPAGEGRAADTASWNIEEAVPAPNPIVAPDARVVVESLGRWLGGLATHPGAAGRRLLNTGAEMGKVAVGRSSVAPAKGDGRFADPTWRENPAYRRLMQGYLAWREGTHALVDEAGLDPKLAHQVRFVLNLVTEAMAPSNGLLTNPAALKRAYETGGGSIARGAARMLEDWRGNHGMPAQADRRKFALGGNLACTPGAVVHRSDMFELLQYSPTTRRTYEVPMLMVPAQLNKYYVVDLAPRRSLMEFAVSREIPTFAISWRNPEPQHREWGFDAYVAAAKEAAEVVREITGADRVNLAGYCGGGLIVALLLAHLTALGGSLVNSATLMVTVLDWDVDSQLGAFVNPRTVAAAARSSKSKGVRSGREMNRFLSWVRPNELVWQFWVNNYLLGADPPAFDLLYWNRDSTNLPHALNVDVLRQFLENPLVTPGAIEILGTPIDLGRVEMDTYILAGFRDHISPWRGCYRTAGLMRGSARFVLSTSGHIAAIVSEPTNKKAAYHSGPADQEDPDRWLAAARQTQGSWWPDWTGWLAARSGSLRTARQRLGSRSHPPLGPAPGQYVLRELADD